MKNTPSIQSIQSLIRMVSRLLPRPDFVELQAVAVSQKMPPKLSLAETFMERERRVSGPQLAWFEGLR